jgi:guanylate kinase
MPNPSTALRLQRDFERALKFYKPSLEILDLLQNMQLVLLVAPSAAGRNTLIRNLIMTGRYYFLVSDTTRLPRINNGVPERNGEDYWFKSEEEFLYGLKNGAYVEAAIIHNQQVSGISFNELRRAHESGRVAITDVEVQGCDNIKSYSDNTMAVFVLPPNFEEWMKRMDGRGAMDPAEKRRRLESAAYEMQLALERTYFKFVINWDIKLTVEEIHEHVISQDFGMAEQVSARTHAKQLLTDLNNYLH